MTKRVLGRSPWRWAVLVVGLFFAGLPFFMVLPWKAWYLGTVPDALIMVVFPTLVVLLGLWIVVTAVRSGLVLDHEHLVNLPYAGFRKRVRIADIAGGGTSFGSNFTAPTVRTSDGKVLLLTGLACSPTEHGYFRSRSIAQEIASQLAVPYEEGTQA